MTPTSTTYPPINIWMEPWISATQISTYELCNRKWAWRWLEGIKAPPNKFAQLGIDTHGKLEKWLRSNVVPGPEAVHVDADHRKRDEKAVELAQAMIPYLPPPQAVNPIDVERDELIVVDDVLFIVKIDLFMPEMQSWDGVTRPRTHDHKTTGDFKWLPEASQIQFDAQAALYTAWSIIHTGKTEIDLQWNYVRTKGAIKVEPVCATVNDAMITPRMQANIKTGREIRHHTFNTKRALDVVHDARACDEYGGCPYRDNCGISGKERIVSIMSDFRNQTATQQFLQGLVPGNGQAVNPPAFQPQQGFGPAQPPAPQFPPQGGPPPQFPPQGGQSAPQVPPQWQPPAPAAAAPPQWQPPAPAAAAPPQWQPPAGPQPAPAAAAPPQWQPPAPAAAVPPQWQPPGQPPQAPYAPQGATPENVLQQSMPAAQEPAKGPGRPAKSKEYDLTGSWAVFMAGALSVTGGNTSQAALLADAALAELKARQ